MPFLWDIGEIGDVHWALIPFFFLLIYYYSLFMFHVINWLAGRGVYFSCGSRWKSMMSYWTGDKKRISL